MEKALTIMDVASKLQLSASTVYKLSESGELPAKKVGKQWRFTEDGITRYLQSCKTTNQVTEE